MVVEVWIQNIQKLADYMNTLTTLLVVEMRRLGEWIANRIAEINQVTNVINTIWNSVGTLLQRLQNASGFDSYSGTGIGIIFMFIGIIITITIYRIVAKLV